MNILPQVEALKTMALKQVLFRDIIYKCYLTLKTL